MGGERRRYDGNKKERKKKGESKAGTRERSQRLMDGIVG